MNCRLWSLASKTFVIAAVCACALDLSQASVVGQETVAEDLTSVKSDEMQVAPSPLKSGSTSVSRRRTTSKHVRKLNVPATLGATKSTRKSENELDKIFASRSQLAPEYIQYAPSVGAVPQTSHSVGSYQASKQTGKTTYSKSFVANAPYVEQMGKIQQTNALSPEGVEPTALGRYPLFEEDALTQESAPLNDEFNGATPESSATTPNRSSTKDYPLSESKPLNPFVETPSDTKTSVTANDDLSTLFETSHDATMGVYASPWSTDSRSVCKFANSSGVVGNRFARYTGIFADFEWLGWQTDSIKQNYAISSSENNRIYDELSLTPSGTGYRGRLGLRTAYGWDLTAAYTTFEADKSGNAQTGVGNIYTVSGTNVDEISARADVDLDIYDVEIGRWITRDSWAARPFAGFRWARLNQTQNVAAWNNSIDEAQNAVVSDYESLFNRSRSDMYGLRLGAEGSVALFRNLSAYGRGAATLALADVSYQTVSTSERNATGVVRRAEKSYASPDFEAAVGLAWRRGGLEVKGGYEFNVFSNASCLNGKSSDFFTRGLFAGVAWNN